MITYAKFQEFLKANGCNAEPVPNYKKAYETLQARNVELSIRIGELNSIIYDKSCDHDISCGRVDTQTELIKDLRAKVYELNHNESLSQSLIKGYLASIANRDLQIKDMDEKVGQLKKQVRDAQQALEESNNRNIELRGLLSNIRQSTHEINEAIEWGVKHYETN